MARDTKGQDKTGRSDEHNSRGIELADRGWLDEAIREFRKAIELDPDSAHAHDNLATVYAEKKQYAQALEEYLTALKLEPDSATAHYNLACFLATHAHEMAIEQYKEAIEIDPEYPDAHLNLGMTYADLDQRDEAKAQFKAAMELDTADALARHELAAMLMDEGDYRGAIVLLKDVVRLEPQNYEGWLDLGISYAQKGFYQEAERCYGKAGELNADDVLLNYNRAALYSLWERRTDAIEALRKALEKEPTKVRGWLSADPMFDGLKGAPEFERLIALQ
jgi:tetratricopeptide (TPR) repeat protein